MRPDLLHAEDAEQAVLAALLLEPERFGSVRRVVDRGDFGESGNRLVWDAIATLVERGEGVDPITLASHLDAAGGTISPFCSTRCRADPTSPITLDW
jgi:replicative DNA helicase